MNILESQVTDLNSLVQSPIGALPASVPLPVPGPAPGRMSGNPQRERHTSSSADSPADAAGDSGKKRKPDDADATETATGMIGEQTHTRAKRNRYISIAW